MKESVNVGNFRRLSLSFDLSQGNEKECEALTIRVIPSPPKLSARSLVSLLSRYGMCPPFFLGSLSAEMQFPVKGRLPQTLALFD